MLTEMNSLNHVNVVVPGRLRPTGHTVTFYNKTLCDIYMCRLCIESAPNPSPSHASLINLLGVSNSVCYECNLLFSSFK